MVSISNRTIQSKGVGKQDYSLNVTNSVSAVSKGHFARSTSGLRLALPGYYTNLLLDLSIGFAETFDPILNYSLAPKQTYHFFDWWTEIYPTNFLYAHLVSYKSSNDFNNDTWDNPLFYEDFGGSYGNGSVDGRISKGIQTREGLIYAFRFMVIDPGYNDFVLFLGSAAIEDEIIGAK